MLILALIVVTAIAASIGYAYGLRRRPPGLHDERTDAALVSRVAPQPAASGEPDWTTIDADRVSAEKARLIRCGEGEAAMLRRALADSNAIGYQAAGFRADRTRLFTALADARGDNARYRQLVIDIENNAPPPILLGAAGPDDLKLIVGIGPVLERMLHNLGIMTFQQVARWSERDIADFDARLPEFPGRIRRDQWVTQARALHQAKYGDDSIDSRSGGRRP